MILGNSVQLEDSCFWQTGRAAHQALQCAEDGRAIAKACPASSLKTWEKVVRS